MYFESRSVCSDIHLPKNNNLTTPRPITDLGVRKLLKDDGSLKDLKIPPKDEKILALMSKKGEFEKEYWKKQLLNGLAWDSEKIGRDKLRLEKDINHRANIQILRDEDRHTVYLNKLERQKKRLEKRAVQLHEIETDHARHNKAYLKQKRHREKEIHKRVEQENDRKEQQEKNWWSVNSAEYDRLLEDKRERDKKRLHAIEKREEIIREEAKKTADTNEHERLTFTERYVVYEKNFEDGRKSLSSRIERKLQSALSNHEQVQKERRDEIHKEAIKEEEHLQHAILTQNKLEKQSRKRLKKMVKKTQKDIELANEKLNNTLDETRHRIHEENDTKEKEQKKNMKRMKKEMQRWRKKLSKEIKQKEEKAKKEQDERQKTIERTRSVAHDTRILRNHVLDNIGFENFDKKILRVERFRSLGSRPAAQDWNTSSISLL